MHRLLIVTREESDFSKMLQACFDASVVPPDFAKEVDLDAYDGFALLGGTREEPIVLQPPQRLRLDAQIGLGKPFFAEYVRAGCPAGYRIYAVSAPGFYGHGCVPGGISPR